MHEEILEHLRRDPFVPFRIVLTSGQGFDVINPGLVALGETTIHVMYPRSDRYAILRQNQIASFEILETAR
jgi:hypothetical protein